MAFSVLVIDTDNQRRQQIVSILEFIEYEAVAVSQCDMWQDAMKNPAIYAAALVGECDLYSQNEMIARIKEKDAELPVIIIDSNKVEELNKDMSSRVLCHIKLPMRFHELNSALQRAQIFRESRLQNGGRRPIELFRSLVGHSRAVFRVRKLMEQVADSEANVLILGESGTGKEVVARNLHYNSSRRNKPFVPINCGAIPGDLLESELFGHEKGAFTGAITARQGRFEMAEGGTLFLDEIGDMSLHMQVKLLRVLQERNFERVGSNKSITTDVRIIAATHRDLEEAIKDGKFREDLFYRLNVFPIEMPPLRERQDDVPLLVNELITRLEHEKRGSVRLTPAAISVLCEYSWPGNVRELANLVERLAILYPYDVVDIQDLPEKFRGNGVAPALTLEQPVGGMAENAEASPSLGVPRNLHLPNDGFDLKEYLNNLEYNYIKQALEETGGVVAHAATRLKMRRTTLVEKMRKYGLQRADETSGI